MLFVSIDFFNVKGNNYIAYYLHIINVLCSYEHDTIVSSKFHRSYHKYIKANTSIVNCIFLFCLLWVKFIITFSYLDRGNDNWLLKYETAPILEGTTCVEQGEEQEVLYSSSYNS